MTVYASRERTADAVELPSGSSASIAGKGASITAEVASGTSVLVSEGI